MANRQLDLLRGLSDTQTAEILALAVRRPLARGETLFRLGAPADAIYVVEQGRILLTLPIQIRDGEEQVVVEEKQPGDTLGWSGLAPVHRFTLNASAAVASEVSAFPRAALLEHFRSQPAVGCVVMQNVAAVIGHRLQVFQTMWLREMQRTVELRYA